jgi:hypothetical protein
LTSQEIGVTFLTPAHRTYKRVSVACPQQTDPSLTSGSLPQRAYKHRRGTWQAVLRLAGTPVTTTNFRVA